MNIKLACRLCNFASDSSKALNNHIKHVHDGRFVEGGLSTQEAKDVLSTLAADSVQKIAK